MKNINSIIIYLAVGCFFLCCAQRVSAGTASFYSDPYLVTFHSKGSIRGYYAAKNDKFSCILFFIAPVSELSGRRHGSYDVLHMRTFSYPFRGDNFTYDRRDRRADIPGELFFQGGDLVVKTNEPQPGCRGVAGLFDGGPGERGVIQYSTVKKIAAVGIYVIKKKTFIYDGAGVKRRATFLVSGDIVVVVRRKAGYSYVRYVNPDFMIDSPGATTNGWIRSSDLVNPFPSSVNN